jgi:hypothetical protein
VIDDALVLRVERLRDSVQELRDSIRARYRKSTSRVRDEELRKTGAQLGERWLIDTANRDDVRQALGEELHADLNIEFQRLITYADRVTTRAKYDEATRRILRDYRTRVVLPLKARRNQPPEPFLPVPQFEDGQVPQPPATAFVGHSFASTDKSISDAVIALLEAYGYTVVTGERPRADSVSAKVKQRIDDAHVFVGLFTRRDKLASSEEWTTSAWIIDEKAYALAKGKKLILVKETGVQTIGGIHGDYEYLEFTRDQVGELLTRLLQTIRPH